MGPLLIENDKKIIKRDWNFPNPFHFTYTTHLTSKQPILQAKVLDTVIEPVFAIFDRFEIAIFNPIFGSYFRLTPPLQVILGSHWVTHRWVHHLA